MSIGKLQLNKIISSDNSLLFETNYGILVADVQISNTMNATNTTLAKYNKWNFNDLSKNIMVNNLYPLSSFNVQSYQYKKDPMNCENNISDFIDLYGPDTLFLKGCQFFDYSYCLSDYTIKNILYKTYNFSDNILEPPSITIEGIPVNTFIYPQKSVIESDITSGKTTFMPLYNLSGVKFNYIEEFPLNGFTYGFDNSDSLSSYNYVFADTINCKNQYDNNYSLSAYITSTSDVYNVSGYLTNSRIYDNIGSCGDILYMTYRNNAHYNMFETDITSTGVYFGITPTSSFASTGAIAELKVSDSITLSTDVIHKYDNVETIGSINRIENSSGHRSNLYSINIQNANVNTSNLTDERKDNIKKTINNLIENMVKNITPVNTQLFNIYWNGK